MLAYVVSKISQNNLAADINRVYFSETLKTAFITVYPTAIPSELLVRCCCTAYAATTLHLLLLCFGGKFSIAGTNISGT